MPIAAVGAIIFGRADSVDLPAAAILVVGSLVGVQIGARLMARVGDDRLRIGFARAHDRGRLTMLVYVTPLEILALLAIGLTAGLLAGLLGIGGGVVMVPAMVLILGWISTWRRAPRCS